jgi:hypothetical protein
MLAATVSDLEALAPFVMPGSRLLPLFPTAYFISTQDAAAVLP